MKTKRALKVQIRSQIKSLAGIRYRKLVQKSWSFSTQEFWDYQLVHLVDILNYAVENVPFYRENKESYIFNHHKREEQDLFDMLNGLPILRKEILKNRNQDFWASPKLPLTSYHSTSGTTGTPIKIAANLWERAKTEAILEEWYLRICGKRNPQYLALSGFMTPSPSSNELLWKDPISKNGYLSIYSLGDSNKSDIVKIFNQVNPKMIYGYASAVNQLAILLDGTSLKYQKNRIVVVTSEILHDDWRNTIEEAFRAQVYNLYGSQEGNHLVLQCQDGCMHINPLIGIVEVVNENLIPVEAGQVGKVLITGLSRRSMPLIRYEIGDLVESTGYLTSCSCGLNWPTIGKIYGRSEDMVKTKDGRRIGYLCFHATKDLEGIKEVQLIQTDYERFICNIVLNDTEIDRLYIEHHISNQIKLRMQIDVLVDFRYLLHIPRGSNGKFKAVQVNI